MEGHGLKFEAVRRGEKVILKCEAPVSAHFAGPGLLREPFKEGPGELCFRFSYQKQLHKERQITGREVPERWEMDLSGWVKNLRRIRILVEGEDDVVIESRQPPTRRSC